MASRPARLGICSYAFRWSIGIGDRYPEQPMSALALLRETGDLGLDLVQYADNLPLHTLDAGEIAELGTEARQRAMTIEIGQQGADMALLARYLDIAAALDASLVRMALDAADARHDQATLVAAFRKVMPDVEARGITLAIENHFGFPSVRLADLVEQVGSNHLGVCLDVANSICAGEWPEETIARLAPYAVNLHLKDYDIVPDPYGVGFRVLGTPLGQGRVDATAVITTLQSARQDYNVLLEHWLPGDADLTTLARREREWLAISLAAARSLLAQRDA